MKKREEEERWRGWEDVEHRREGDEEKSSGGELERTA